MNWQYLYMWALPQEAFAKREGLNRRLAASWQPRTRIVFSAGLFRACAAGVGMAAIVLGPSATLAHSRDEVPSGYRLTIRHAVAEFGIGNWHEASILFEKAHGLFPNARTLRGLGMTNFQLRRYPRAVERLEAALSSDRRRLTDRQALETRKLLERARALVGQIHVAAAPSKSELLVDGKSRPLGTEVLVNAGEHTVSVRAVGYERYSQIHIVPAGKTLRVHVELEAKASRLNTNVAVPSVPVGNFSLPRNPEESLAPDEMGPGPYVMIGGGVAMLGGALVTGLMTSSADRELVSAGCAEVDGCAEAQLRENRPRGRTLQAVTNVLLAAGMVATVGGGVWWLLGGRAESSEANTRTLDSSVACLPSGCSASLQGRF